MPRAYRGGAVASVYVTPVTCCARATWGASLVTPIVPASTPSVPIELEWIPVVTITPTARPSSEMIPLP